MDHAKFTNSLDQNNLMKFPKDTINVGFYVVVSKKVNPITTIHKGEPGLHHEIRAFSIILSIVN